MRSHAKASTAGSRRRIGKSKPALLLCVLVACVATLALTVGSASGATTRFLVEVFGSSAQPSFSADRGMAYDQGAGHLYVIDSTADTLQRFNANGTAASFGALGSNAIDGEGTGDETPLGHLAFESNRQREQVAIDESGTATDGNLYVTQSAKDVVDVFNSEGEYLGALSESTKGTTAFGEPCGVAVDDEGTVYVGDRGDDRIHVFDPAGAVPVNADNTASYATVTDPCTMAAGDAATDGFLFVAASTGAQLRKVDAATGAVKYEIATGASTVSVDPTTGHVFVARNTGTSSQVDEYDASGAGSATLVSSFKPGQTVEGIALNSTSEQVYVARASTENVEVFGPAAVIPDVVTSPPSSNTGTRATLAGTVNPDGVELDECFFEWGQGSGTITPYTNTAPCAEFNATIGSGTTPVAVHADISGLKPQGTSYHYRLVAKNPSTPTVNGSNQNFSTPNTVTAEAASGLTPTEATLNGMVNPDTASLSGCQFEWGPPKTEAETFQKYPNTAPCVPGPGGIGTGESPVAVQATISGLEIGTTYVYRLRATYPGGDAVHPSGTPLSLQTAGPVIAGSWSENVIRTEATLKAQINPAGQATTYRFEYGTSEAYGSETPELNVGSDSSVHEVARFLEGLTSGTTYHYRVIATNGTAENVGPDRTFTSYEPFVAETDCPNQANRYGASGQLPDCRAYEMVSPVDKAGADIEARINSLGYQSVSDQAAVDGDKFTYTSAKPFGDAASNLYGGTQYMASRGSNGWANHAISPTHKHNIDVTVSVTDQVGRFASFTHDLSIGFLFDDAKPPLTADATPEVYNSYLRDNSTGALTALTREALPPIPTGSANNLGGMSHKGYSDDGSHTIFSVTARLTPDSPMNNNVKLYDYHGGELELVSVLPSGEPATGDSTAGSGGFAAHFYRSDTGEVRNAISDDGSRIFWMTNFDFSGGAGEIFARIDGDETISVSKAAAPGNDASYWGASSDGKVVVFSGNESSVLGSGIADLYKFDVDTETTTHVAGGVHETTGVLGISDDASRIYFLSSEVLAPGAVAGEPNLYLDQDGSKTLVATLARSDLGSGGESAYGVASRVMVLNDFSQVTPDGRHLIFQSLAPLTGYDNTSLRTGKAAAEIFIFDAYTDQLDCVSCNPSGARPQTRALVRPHRFVESVFTGIDAAAWLPTPRRGTYTPRMMTDDGSRVFFNAYDALVPRDTNGVQDVYQWVAKGTEGCDEVDGCVDLISTGTHPAESTFVDANEGGRDVFIRTEEGIDPRDLGLIDIYDARVGGGFPRPVVPIECVGDACQSVPEPPVAPTPASAGFRGAGDPVPRANCGTTAKRALALSRRAKLLRRKAKRAKTARRTVMLRKQSRRLARRAKGLSKRATRCRRANRRANR